MRLQLRTALALTAVLVLGLPAIANASGRDVIRDCAQNGKLTKHYSLKDLRAAERGLPSDIDEYTDCRAVIRAAMGGGSGSGGPAGGIVTASGAVAGSQNDIAALQGLIDHGAKGKRDAVLIDGRSLLPGNAGMTGLLGGLQGANGMPTALMLAIASLLILALAATYLAARDRVPQLRRVALRILGR
jgi:hypothetical protein